MHPYLSHFLLEGQGHLRPAKSEGTLSCRDHRQPLNEEWDGHVEGKVADNMEVGRICNIKKSSSYGELLCTNG